MNHVFFPDLRVLEELADILRRIEERLGPTRRPLALLWVDFGVEATSDHGLDLQRHVFRQVAGPAPLSSDSLAGSVLAVGRRVGSA